VHSWIVPESARAPGLTLSSINILQKPSFVLENTGIFQAGAVLQSPDIPTEDAGSATWQAAYEDIPAVAVSVG